MRVQAVGCMFAGMMFSVLSIGGCSAGEDLKSGIGELFKPAAEVNMEVDATVAEIDAVAGLKSDSAKLAGFRAIASRNGLPEMAQVHLVTPVIETLYSDSDKQEVLLLLINNSGFTHAAKKEIIDRFDKIKPEQIRITILGAINKRDSLR